MQLRCAACGYVNQLVDESTAFCPNCGSAYLTPPDPGILPHDATQPQSAPQAHVPTPASWTPEPPPAPPFTATPPSTLPSSDGKEQPRRRNTLVLGLVIAAVVVLGAVGFVAYAIAAGKPVSAAAAPTPTATPMQKPLTFKHYVDPQGLFSLNYPSTWQITTTSSQTVAAGASATSFAGENRAAIVTIYVGGPQLTLSNAVAEINQHDANSFTVLRAPQTVTLDGISWQEERGVFLKDGRNVDINLLVTQQNGHTYLVTAASAELTFGRIESTIFLPMLESLSFGTS
jgi:hypothetical protein